MFACGFDALFNVRTFLVVLFSDGGE